MATLAESFLADLEDLSDVEEEEQEQEQNEDQEVRVQATAHPKHAPRGLGAGMRWHRAQAHARQGLRGQTATKRPRSGCPTLQMLGDDLDALNYDDLEAVAHLASSEKYATIMAAVRRALEEGDAGGGGGGGGAAQPEAWTGPSEEDPTYK